MAGVCGYDNTCLVVQFPDFVLFCCSSIDKINFCELCAQLIKVKGYRKIHLQDLGSA